jgi:hypothetical protein
MFQFLKESKVEIKNFPTVITEQGTKVAKLEAFLKK